MKFYKTTYELAQPSIHTINVPTDVETYAVGVKITKKGEDVTGQIANLTMNGNEPTLYKNGYAVYHLSAGSDTTGELNQISAQNTDYVYTTTEIAEGGKMGRTSRLNWSRTLSCDMQQYLGAKITVDGSYLQRYQDGVAQDISIKDQMVMFYTDGSDPTCTRITLNPFDSEGGSYPDGKGVYFFNSETLEWVKQPEDYLLVDEHLVRYDYTWIDSPTNTPAGTVMKFELHFGGPKVDGNFKLQVTHKETGEGAVADVPMMRKNVTASGWYTDGTPFTYNIPLGE